MIKYLFLQLPFNFKVDLDKGFFQIVNYTFNSKSFARDFVDCDVVQANLFFDSLLIVIWFRYITP